jgi:hypothetical protein
MKRIYLQVLPQCASDASVEECRGYLLRIMRWNNGWVATEFDHALNLVWSFKDAKLESVTLDPGVDKRLNVLWFDNKFVWALEVYPQYAGIGTLALMKGPFRFDIRIFARDCVPIDLQLEIDLGITGGQLIDWQQSVKVKQL